MLFNSTDFLLIFLPIVFVIYFGLNRLKLINLATGWLVLASLYFYSYWKLDYLPIILGSMILNYSFGCTLSNNKLRINKKVILVVGIILNILLLTYFKYFDFLVQNLNHFFHSDFNYMHLMLPLGISFFTFQQIVYISDSYKGLTKEYDFLTYALFVTFFPQLIAGPIVHHKDMMPQFGNLRNKFINHKNVFLGLFFLAIGLAKKVLIADYFSPIVYSTFDAGFSLSCFESWIASICYTFQLYFDFSGYCDMAIGLGYLFNIKLPQNFNSPYRADSIQDFWRRWHITLSKFLRDYIYIPLGGNRESEAKTYRNLFLTFLIGGIWHGANWTFIIWGMLHGIATVAHRIYSKFKITTAKPCAVFFTFFFVNLTWVFFRAHNISRAFDMIKSMFGFNGFEPIVVNKLRFVFQNGELKVSFFLLGIAIILLFLPNSNDIAKKIHPNVLFGTVILVVLVFSILQLNKISEFLYFQF